jgi:hypothetical protein
MDMEVPAQDELDGPFDLALRAQVCLLVRLRLRAMRLSASDRHMILFRFMADEPVSLARLGRMHSVSVNVIRARETRLKGRLREQFWDLRDAA